MTDINDLVQEFWSTSSEGATGATFFEMRRLYEILEGKVSLYQFRLCDCLADYNIKTPYSSNYSSSQSVLDETESRAKFKIMLDGYRKMFDQSFSKSKDLGDMLRLLPGVVVQKEMSMQGMTELYEIKLDLLEHLIKSTIEPLRLRSLFTPRYTLDDYLSGFLQDRDRSQLCYCDPILQHVSICCHILSLLDGTNALGLES